MLFARNWLSGYSLIFVRIAALLPEHRMPYARGGCCAIRRHILLNRFRREKYCKTYVGDLDEVSHFWPGWSAISHLGDCRALLLSLLVDPITAARYASHCHAHHHQRSRPSFQPLEIVFPCQCCPPQLDSVDSRSGLLAQPQLLRLEQGEYNARNHQAFIFFPILFTFHATSQWQLRAILVKPEFDT